jgi:hypothetical protein
MTPKDLTSEDPRAASLSRRLAVACTKRLLSFPQFFPQPKGYLAKAIFALLQSKNWEFFTALSAPAGKARKTQPAEGYGF